MTNSEHDISWALKLLEREPDLEENIVTKYFHVGLCTLTGASAPALANYLYKRPLSAGIQNIIIFGIVGGLVGAYLKAREVDILATRDAKMRHYITLHPEDFPPPERKKYADLFLPWDPVR
ncbi:NADH dehydrogenase [ubiquinone] 1 subunit C2 [Chelonus insularis]|uniref:NADH dehydrogenase [ubiquinone] 1 subunit C2 n=1 Tax=Chelonus insularis TaxID=460826 RepID=UPI00158E13DF|nr:NADH dehydrogenase [ubiquinone] 1 subunit C2 [Chelonus insularis]